METDIQKNRRLQREEEARILKQRKESNVHEPPEEIDPLENKKKKNIPKHEAVELEKSKKEENFWDTPEGKAQLSKG